MSLFRREVISAVIASSFAGYMLRIFMAYLGVYLDQLGTIALIVGIVFFSRNFFQIFLRVPLAEVSQIYGRKPLITLGVFCYALAFLLLNISSSWVLVLIGTIVVAVGMAAYWPAMFAYIGDITTDDFGKVNGYIFQGSDIGVIIGTFAAQYLLGNNIVDLNGLFLINTVVGLAGAGVIYLILSEVLDDENRMSSTNVVTAVSDAFQRSWYSLKTMTKKKPFWLIYSFQMLISFLEFFLSSFFPLLIVVSKGYSDADVSRIILYTTLILFIFKPYLGRISDKFGFRYPVLITLTISATTLYLLTLVQSFWVIVGLYCLIFASSLTSYLAVNGATSYASDSKTRGLAMGALGLYVSLGRSLSSVILTPIWEFLERTSGNRGESLVTVFHITAVLVIIFNIILYFSSRKVPLEATTSDSAIIIGED